MLNLNEIGANAKAAARKLASAAAKDKNAALYAMAEAILNSAEAILAANAQDVEAARARGTSESMIDRLKLTQARIEGMAKGVRDVAGLDDPVGRILSGETLHSGLRIEKRTVPLGVIAIIFEARPNVTSDAAALCLKSGNACILRGGSEAIRSNTAVANAMRAGLETAGFDPNCVTLMEDTSRESATQLMRLNQYVDLLIPRGGAGLIRSVVENATVPVVETGVGNCHVYVEKTADIAMAAEIIFNAKTSRPSVCNAMETLLIDREIAAQALPVIAERLAEKQVELRGCRETMDILPQAVEAADHRPGVAAEFVGVLLELVQLLDHRHRDHDIVIPEGFHALAAVEQHIGIQDKGLDRFAVFTVHFDSFFLHSVWRCELPRPVGTGVLGCRYGA